MDRYVFHVDANSAFLSWTATYRTHILGEKTDLRSIPSVIGGDQEKRHGIVLAKSIPAKKYGIQTGEPLVSAVKKYPALQILPPDYSLYVKASRALMDILKNYSDHVIQYSIDEAWVIFDGFESLYGKSQMVEFAYFLKGRIQEQLGFTVNIGVSNNLLLAKMAGDFSKPDKVHTLFPDEILKKMWPLPVSDLFFVGHATESKLKRLGITTIGELAEADPKVIYSFLKKPGLIIQGYAMGHDLEPYLFSHDNNKGYGNSMTAPVDVVDTEYAHLILLSLCETVSARIREDNVKIGVVSIHITSCFFEYSSKQMKLATPTDITEDIYKVSVALFDQLWDNTPVRQMGVHTTHVQSDTGHQYSIFDIQTYDKLSALDRTVDHIRKRYGEDAIMRASFLKANISHMSGGLDKERRSGVTLGIDLEKEIKRPQKQ